MPEGFSGCAAQGLYPVVCRFRPFAGRHLTQAVKPVFYSLFTGRQGTSPAGRFGYDGVMSERQRDGLLDVVVDEARPRVRQPPLFRVVMINDDFTPMDFVVQTLQTFFYHAREAAVQIMLQVHTHGRAVAGLYPAEIAETKVAQVNAHARAHQHPLLTVMERA